MTYKFPKTPGSLADMRYKLKLEVAEANKKVTVLKEKQTALDEHIISTFPKSNVAGVTGKVGKVAVVSKIIPVVTDRPKFNAYIKRTGRFDLLQARVNNAPIQELWDEGKKIPGVGTFTKVSVSVGKA